MKLKKPLAALITAALIPALSGCGGLVYTNYRDLSSLQPIQTVGIDRQAGIYTITASTGESTPGKPPVIISRSGGSISSARESIQNYSSSESLYFAHTRFVIFGEESAKNSIEEFLDFSARSSMIRMDAGLFVVKGDTAENLIINSAAMGIDVTENLSAIRRDVRRQGTAFAFSGREIAASNAEYGSALVCAVKPPERDGDATVDESKMVLVSDGYGIIRQGKLCGFLDEDLAWATNVLLGEPGFASMDLKLSEDQTVSLYSVTGDAKYSARWDADGNLSRIMVDIDVEGYLIEMNSSPTDNEEEEFRNAIAAALENETKARCLEVLTLTQELESDFLKLTGVLRHKYPREIYALDGPFVNTLKNADIEVSVKGSVLRSYDVEGVPQILDGGISK